MPFGEEIKEQVLSREIIQRGNNFSNLPSCRQTLDCAGPDIVTLSGTFK